MRDQSSNDEIDGFLNRYLCDSSRIDTYKKSKRLEKIATLCTLPFMGIALYGTVAYLALFINNILQSYFGLGFNDYFSLIPSHMIVVVILGISWLSAFGMIDISVRLRDRADNAGIDQNFYPKYRLAKSYDHFEGGDHKKALSILSDFGEKRPNIFSRLNIWDSIYERPNSIIQDEEDDGELFTDDIRQYITDYVETGYNGNEIDEEFLDETFVDFFRLLIEELSYKYNHRDLMFEAITSDEDDAYYADSGSIEEGTKAPTYSEIMGEVVKESIPEIQYIWIVYLLILVMGLMLAQTNGIIAVVVVSVLLSALQIYERRVS